MSGTRTPTWKTEIVALCIGTNMTECHPVAATFTEKAHGPQAELIVADHGIIRLAEMADLYLPLRGYRCGAAAGHGARDCARAGGSKIYGRAPPAAMRF
ncbi:MAG: hypothetical protein R2911_09515 [Caldilineaceae bacterium]